ncbi:vacuolar protein sorting-associated protein 41 homolog isoform X5 [Arachis hypogaea]|uniref:vacuolar protein sorting-associated protein 41 homolog isoform X5 n=1 Tax=Arachis hypogaea TaxID=3818 RepID=UPI003B21700D
MRSRVRDQRVRGGHRRNAAAAAAITVVEEGVQRREREKDDSQTKWRERMKTRREREGGCFAVHCRRSWGQLKPPPLLGLAVLLSSLSASTIDFLRFISAIFDANGTDAILSFEKFCCNLPRPLLQDKVPAFSPKKAKSFIESELGASISLLFREFEDRPIAATSLGQLMKPELFDFIDKYNLQDSIHEKVELYADYDPKMLLPFLHSSQHYTLEKAYEICTKKELLKEQVFILGRMRNSKQALAVIINKLGDIKEAVEFVTMQNDYELWEELIKQCIDKPEMVGMLLEHTVGNLDPLYIVNKAQGSAG